MRSWRPGLTSKHGMECGRTPSQYLYAARRVRLGAVLALLKYGAGVNAHDDNQGTPLHWGDTAGTPGGAELAASPLSFDADETILDDQQRKVARESVGIYTETCTTLSSAF